MTSQQARGIFWSAAFFAAVFALVLAISAAIRL
jgi:hypothetical protein